MTMTIDAILEWIALFMVFAYANAPVYFSLIWMFLPRWKKAGPLVSAIALLGATSAVASSVYVTRDFWLSWRMDFGNALAAIGYAAFLAGCALMVAADFALGGLPVRLGLPHISGQRRKLATTGAYSKMRHPMYTAAFLMGLGLSLAAGFPMLGILAMLWLALMRFFTDREERVLEEEYGKEYLEYKKRTPGFFPGFR